MALKIYKNKATGEVKRSLKELDSAEWEETITAPNQKFMVAANESKGTSKLKDSEKTLRARARNYARDVDLDDNISLNRKNGLDQAVTQNFLNTKGERRRKIDDI